MPPPGAVFLLVDGNRKGGTRPQTGEKSVRWTLLSPWEIPLFPDAGCNPVDENKLILERVSSKAAPWGGIFIGGREWAVIQKRSSFNIF